MRQGSFELLVVGENDMPYLEHLVDGKPCVQAEAGKEYHVKINTYRNKNGQFPAKYLRFGLYVDGYDVQYWKRIDLSNEKLLPTDPLEPVCSKFWGFKKNVNDLRSFVFSIPTTSTECSAKVADYTGLGVVKLVVYEAEVSTGVYANQDGYFEAPSQQEVGETAKFWKQASVTTSAGKKVVSEKEKFTPLPRWSNKSSEPMAKLSVQYHTGAMIEFLKEFQHRLHDGVGGHASSGTSSSSSGCRGSSSSSSSRSGGGGARYYKSYLGSAGSSCAGLEVLDLTADSGDDEPQAANTINNYSSSSSSYNATGSTDGDVHENDNNPADADPSRKRQRLDGEHTPLCKEVPIDEDIAYLVRKKVVPFLDLSSEQAAEEGESSWSTMTTSS